MRCAVWYQLYIFKNVKKLLSKSNAHPWVFFTFFKLYKKYQVAQCITYIWNVNTFSSLVNGLKGTWGQSNNFCWKWSFFIIKRNDNYKKLRKFTCKPQLTYFVCLFVFMTSLTQWYSLIVQDFATSHEKWLKTP